MTLAALMAREAAVGAAINGALSAGFAWALFGGSSAVAGSALAADAVPQSFAVAFMATLVPTLLTRARMRRGDLSAGVSALAAKLPAHALIRALVVAVPIALVSGVVQWIALADRGPFDPAAALVGKTLFGAGLGAIVTVASVHAAIGDRSSR